MKRKSNMKRNPATSYLEGKEKLAAVRKQEDTRLWQTWRQNPSPQNLDKLIQRFEPMFSQQVRMIKAPRVQESALRGQLMMHAIDAFKTYDPSRAALSTHVQGRLIKGLRFVQQTQNMAAIPEAKSSLIGPIGRARDELMEQLGRAPKPKEIASHIQQSGVRLPKSINLTPKLVDEVWRASHIKDIPASSFESDPTPRMASRAQEVLSLLRPSLQPSEQEVFDYFYGMNGKPKVQSTNALAQRLGKSPSQISRIKSKIEAQRTKYMK